MNRMQYCKGRSLTRLNEKKEMPVLPIKYQAYFITQNYFNILCFTVINYLLCNTFRLAESWCYKF